MRSSIYTGPGHVFTLFDAKVAWRDAFRIRVFGSDHVAKRYGNHNPSMIILGASIQY